jgi:hypothetical protein
MNKIGIVAGDRLMIEGNEVLPRGRLMVAGLLGAGTTHA